MGGHDSIQGATIQSSGPDGSARGPADQQGPWGQGVALGPRFGAKTVDWLGLFGVLFVIVGAALATALNGAQLTPDNLQELQPQLTSSLALRTATVSAGILPGLYFTLAEGLTGRTLGKRLIGLRVIGPDGRPPGVTDAFRRNLWQFALLIPAGFGAAAMLAAATSVAWSVSSNEHHRGWHDRFGETTVRQDR